MAPPSSALPAPDPRKATIASRVAAQLRGEILSGALAPGAKVNLDRLRERLDVSLAPVREAMTRLLAEGLVELEDQRGYHVAPVSRANLDEVIRLRAELEPLALGLAIERGTIEWEGAVMAALHRLTRTPRAGADSASTDAWEAAHARFHLALIEGCGMPMLIGFCQRLHLLDERYHRLPHPAGRADRDAATDHAALAAATTARHSAEAVALLASHIAQSGAELRDALAATLPDLNRP